LQLNWACEVCGRPFGRRFSAERHLRLKHKFYGKVIDYPSYLYRVHSGSLPPPELKTGQTPRSVPFGDRFMDKVLDELENRDVKDFADQFFSKGNNINSSLDSGKGDYDPSYFKAKYERLNTIMEAFEKKSEELRKHRDKI